MLIYLVSLSALNLHFVLVMAKRKDYQLRLQNLRNRRYDVALSKAIVSESFSREARASVKYVYEAMEPIAASYTAKTYDEAKRVQAQIDTVPMSFQFDYQGSVPLNTHIRLHSDLDILVVRTVANLKEGFTSDQLLAANNLLKDARTSVEAKLRSAYPAAKVDASGCKCLNITGGSLSRCFDVIMCSWYDNATYTRSGLKQDRQIWLHNNCKFGQFDNPFSHMHQVNLKDTRVGGGYKRIIRLLKTLRSDATPQIKLSSFLITSVMYHMADAEYSQTNYSVAAARRMSMLVNTRNHLDKLVTNELYRRSLSSPNNSEKLFDTNDAAQVIELRKLRQELDDILMDLAEEVESTSYFQKSFSSPAEAFSALNRASVIYG